MTNYLVSVPAAYLYTFTFGFGIIGLWIGLYNGIILQLIILKYGILNRADWNKIAEDSKIRMSQEENGPKAK